MEALTLTRTTPLSLWAFSVVKERTGDSHAAWYRQMAQELAPRPIKIGAASRWPSHEVEALIAARIAGKSDDEIKGLVKIMYVARLALCEAPA